MKYVALFRGINVGGKHIVKMNDLRQLLESLGFDKVNTYIQSGNAIFESVLDEASLQDAIHLGFIKQFGFDVDVMIRNMDEMASLVEQFPFTQEEIEAAKATNPSVEHIYIYFFNNAIKQSEIDAIREAFLDQDLLLSGEKELYILCYQSIRESKKAILIAKKFNSYTVRNWKTVKKLYEMLNAL